MDLSEYKWAVSEYKSCVAIVCGHRQIDGGTHWVPRPVVIAVEIGLPWKGLGVILQTGRGVEAASLVNTWDFVGI